MKRFFTSLLIAFAVALSGPTITVLASGSSHIDAGEADLGHEGPRGGVAGIPHCGSMTHCGPTMIEQRVVPDSFSDRALSLLWPARDDQPVYSTLAKADPPVPRSWA